MAKYPYRAYIKTEHGGIEYKRAATLNEAIDKASSEPEPRDAKGKRIAITERYVTDTKGNNRIDVAWRP